MTRVFTLLLICGTVTGWAAIISPGCFVHFDTSLQTVSHRDEDDAATTSRRGMLGTVFTAASLTFLPLTCSARDRSSAVPSTNCWPYASSLLPPASRATLSSSVTVSYDANDDPLASFGMELSGMKSINSSNMSVNATGGGLNQAIDQSMKKKLIDPRTHG